MFGFSIGKLLLLAAIVLGVWYGFRLFGRSSQSSLPRDDGQSSKGGAIDTEYDPETGTYVPKDKEDR